MEDRREKYDSCALSERIQLLKQQNDGCSDRAEQLAPLLEYWKF
jgi:hypothetical protein